MGDIGFSRECRRRRFLGYFGGKRKTVDGRVCPGSDLLSLLRSRSRPSILKVKATRESRSKGNTRLNFNSEELTQGCLPSMQSFSVQCLCSFDHLNLFFLLASLRCFFLCNCLEGQHPGVASSLLPLRLVLICGCYFMMLPVEASVSQTRHSNALVLLLSCANSKIINLD